MTDRLEMAGTEAELNSMVTLMEEMHQDVMPKVRGHVEEFSESLRAASSKPLSRRIFVMGSAGAAGALTLAACGSKKSAAPAASPTPSSTKLTGDYLVVGLAAALENLAVAAYGYVLTEATAGKYGPVPGAIASFATTAKAQHTDHAGAWNSVLTGAGLAPVSTPALSITTAQVTELKGQTTLVGVAKQAMALENAAASTYLLAAGAVKSAGGIAIASTIAPVEAQHAAILAFVLGDYPIPASFITTTGAVPPSAFTG